MSNNARKHMMLSGDVPVPHEDGSFISQRVSDLVETIRGYDPNIDVRWIPPSNRAAGDPAFALVDTHPGRAEYVIMYVQSEKEFDGSVLERVIKADMAKNGRILDDVEAQNAAVRLLQIKKQQDELAEAHDLAHHILKSPKARYKHNGVVYE